MEPEDPLACSQEPSTGPYPEPDQSNPYHPITLRSILILSTHLRLGLPSGCLLLTPPRIIYMHFSSPRSCYMPCPSHPPWLDHSNYIWRRVQVMKFLIMQFSPTSCHFIPLRSALFSNTLSLCSSLNVRDQVSSLSKSISNKCRKFSWDLYFVSCVKSVWLLFRNIFKVGFDLNVMQNEYESQLYSPNTL
jgi:hypothetical protein